jgi:putative (di)nucleoside polyphosphate hydrolase
VAALLVDASGRLLICERRDFSNSWQFPQGGRDSGETPLEALHRELMEEISVPPSAYTVEQERGGYRYWFPARHRRRGRFVGQQQTYFLCRYHGDPQSLNLETAHPEFQSYQWIRPEGFDLRWLPDFKREVYRNVLVDFFGIKTPLGLAGGPSQPGCAPPPQPDLA